MSTTTPQHTQDTNSTKKVWIKPEVFLIDSNRTVVRGGGAATNYYEVHDGGHDIVFTHAKNLSYTRSTTFYNSHHS